MTRSTTPTLRRSLAAGGAFTLISLALLALAACGAVPSVTNSPTKAPLPSAASVLQKAETATFKDVKFDIIFSTTVSGTSINGTGTGEMTEKPELMQMTLTVPLPGATSPLVIEQITDVANKVVYTKSTGPGQNGKWKKESQSQADSSANSVGIDTGALTDLSSFRDPTMIGADTINGVAVWHLRSTPGSSSSASTKGTPGPGASATATAAAKSSASTSTTDLFVRQDNDLPARMTIDETSGTTPLNMTIDFTTYNSGLTITIPRV